MGISLLLAVAFIGVVIVVLFSATFFLLMKQSGVISFSPAQEHTLRYEMIVASFFGFILPGIIIKLEATFGHLWSRARRRIHHKPDASGRNSD